MSYRPGRSARKMYRHKARYGTAGMSKRQLRALRREMDIGVNPRGHRGHRRKNRTYGRRTKHVICPMTKSSNRWYYTHRGERGARPPSRRNPVLMNPPRRVKVPKGMRLTNHRHLRSNWEWEQKHGHKHKRRGRNPKRDGSPTRGEMRRSKFEVHLAAIVQRGEETKAKLKLVKRAPIGSKTPHFYEQQSALKPHVVEAAIPSAPAVVRQERAEVSEAMHELNEALAHLQGRLRDIGEDAPDDEIDEVHRQIADIAKQKKKLREAAESTPVMSNPRPRGGRGYHLRGLASYARSLGRYCNAIHAYCRQGRSSHRARR